MLHIWSFAISELPAAACLGCVPCGGRCRRRKPWRRRRRRPWTGARWWRCWPRRPRCCCSSRWRCPRCRRRPRSCCSSPSSCCCSWRPSPSAPPPRAAAAAARASSPTPTTGRRFGLLDHRTCADVLPIDSQVAMARRNQAVRTHACMPWIGSERGEKCTE